MLDDYEIREGVETLDPLARAQEAARDAAQGFHLARPLPLADVPGSWPGRPCATRTRPRAPAVGGDHPSRRRHSVVTDGGR